MVKLHVSSSLGCHVYSSALAVSRSLALAHKQRITHLQARLPYSTLHMSSATCFGLFLSLCRCTAARSQHKCTRRVYGKGKHCACQYSGPGHRSVVYGTLTDVCKVWIIGVPYGSQKKGDGMRSDYAMVSAWLWV